MRPYWAIIKDSFRAALASRVLYVLLGIITVLLLALAPFHVREVLDWKLQFEQHVKNPSLLVQRLVEGKDNPDRPELAHIWQFLPNGLQNDLVEIAKDLDPDADEKTRTPGGGHRMGKFADLVKQLNEIIQDRTFYRKQDWAQRPQNLEAEQLIAAGPESLSEERSRRLNRLLIDSALAPAIQSGSATALDFYYAKFKWDFLSRNQTQQQFAADVASFIPNIFDKFVLSIGLLIAILVTANIIPETFEPGSLNLLLSKPVSRWGLFLSKFFGGCAFVALCAVYLFLGTWLWLGLGLGIWDRAFLWSIPLYILVFAIYYSVSALIGLSYRSAILSIIVTGLFWAFCFGVGSGYGLLHSRMENMKLVGAYPVGPNLMSVSRLGSVVGWNEKKNEWEEQAKANLRDDERMGLNIAMYISELRDEPPRLPPIFDAQSRTIITGLAVVINPTSKDHQEFYVASVDDMKFSNAGKFPRYAMRLFAAKNGPIVVNGSGKFLRLPSEKLAGLLSGNVIQQAHSQVSDEEVKQPDAEVAAAVPKPAVENADDAEATDSATDTEAADNKTAEAKRTGLSTVDTMFEAIGPDRAIAIRSSANVAFNQSTEEIAIYDRNTVTIYRPNDDGKYQQHRSLEIETGTPASMSCEITFAGKTILLMLGNGQVITVDAEKMVELNGYLPESRFAIEQVTASRDGRWFALVYRNKTAWLLDMQNSAQIRQANVSGQGGVSAIGFDDQDRMWVIDRTDRASRYDLATMSKDTVHAPTGNWLDMAYRYVVRPFYRICPKPSEFYKVVTHLSSNSDTSNNREVDLTRAETPNDPWSPLWSGLGFMVTILLISCAVFHFKDY